MKSFWTMAALVVGVVSLLGFVHVTANGTIIGSPEQNVVPDEVRSRPGAYRSFHFWHVGYGGYRGGK